MPKIFSSKLFLLGVLAEISWLLLYFIPFHWPDPGMPVSLHPNLWLLGGVFILTTAIYVIGYCQKKENTPSEYQTILFFFILFGLTNLFLPPLGSADVLSYIMSGRVIAIHHSNPYIFPTNAFQDPDPVFILFGYRHGLELVYGPIWAIMTAAITWLGQANFTLSLLLFQFFSLLASLATLVIIHRIAQKKIPNQATTALYLLAWNPLWIFETINNAHNETFMILFFVLFLLALTRERWVMASVWITFSILVKYIYILAIPFFLWYVWKKIGNNRARLIFFIKSIGLSSLLFFLTFAPFWAGQGTFVGFKRQSEIFVPVALAPLKIIIFASLATMDAIWPIPVPIINLTQFISLLLFSLFMFGLWLSLKKQNTTDHWHTFLLYSTGTILLYIILFSPIFNNWYSIWFFPLAVLWLKYRQSVWRIILLFTITSLSAYIFNRNSVSLPFLVITIGLVPLFLVWKKVYRSIWRRLYGSKISF